MFFSEQKVSSAAKSELIENGGHGVTSGSLLSLCYTRIAKYYLLDSLGIV